MDNRRLFLKQTLGTGMSAIAAPRLLATAANMGREACQPRAMIVATTSPTSIRSGLEAMKEGGTAADAVLTTALSQIAICAGCWVSYAGRMTAVYFHAASGRLHALNACYDAPRDETDPASIPSPPTPSGRTVLVPGFMAGVESMHKKFGNRSFNNLFEPAIQLADEGFPLTRNLANLIRGKQLVLTRYDEGRQVFTDEQGSLYKAGDHFRQPLLAKTLKGVAEEGARYMYDGHWGRELVRVAGREGGKISVDDLKRYAPTWTEPLSTDIGNGITIHGLPSPNRGGPIALASLNLAAHAKLADHGHYTKSVEALRRILKIETASRIINWDRGRTILSEWLGKQDLTRDDYVDAGLGSKLWKLMQSEKWDQILAQLRAPQPNKSDHSDAVVAIDPEGNVAAIIHTINTAGWGTTGLFVEGVSIPDSAANQQSAIAQVGPGGRMPDHGPPLIATQNGKPVLAGSATGSGNVSASWQNFVDVLLYGMNVQEAADSANFYNRTFEESALEEDFVRQATAAGILLKTKPRFGGFERGFWAGIGIDPITQEMNAGKVRLLDGISVQF